MTSLDLKDQILKILFFMRFLRYQYSGKKVRNLDSEVIPSKSWNNVQERMRQDYLHIEIPMICAPKCGFN